MYVAIDGPDGVGKSTLIQQLAEVHDTNVIKEPFREFFDFYSNAEGDIREEPFAAALVLQATRTRRRQEINKLRPVISDRCFLSTIAYQGLDCAYNERCSIEEGIKRIMALLEGTFNHIEAPDLIIWLSHDKPVHFQGLGEKEHSHEEINNAFKISELFIKRVCRQTPVGSDQLANVDIEEVAGLSEHTFLTASRIIHRLFY